MALASLGKLRNTVTSEAYEIVPHILLEAAQKAFDDLPESA